MATPYPASVGLTQVGSYFVQQYYQVLQQQPDFVHQFYNDSSSMVRVDGDSSETASDMIQIHELITSLTFTGIEVKTINSLESLSGGVLVAVSGSVKAKDFSGWRKFIQTFLLAPQENGYFVLNDVFHFVSDEVIDQHQAPTLSENKYDSQQTATSGFLEPPVSDYGLEAEASEYMNSVQIEEDDTVDEYGLQEHHLQQESESETEEEETVVEEQSDSLQNPAETPQNVAETVQEPLPSMEESIGERPKLSYASILRAAKGEPSVAAQPTKSIPPPSDWHYSPQPAIQQSYSVPSSVPDSNVEAPEEGLFFEEGESKSVYVRNLPSTVSTADILHEFKNFGRITNDGVFLRNRKDIGVCYAFVEFEDVHGVQNAIKASPIQLAGRQVYIEERRANASSSTRGGRRGRGRGSYQNDTFRGRGGARTYGRGNY